MLAIKLQRIGKKSHPSYRLVVAEKRSKMKAPPVEDLGAYSTFTKKATFNAERIAHWVKMGAQPTPTVQNLLVREKILNMPKAKIKMNKKAGDAGAAAPAPEAAPAA